jgi:hypothetical protein
VAARDAAATLMTVTTMLSGPGVQAVGLGFGAGSSFRAALAVAEERVLETEKVGGAQGSQVLQCSCNR